MNEFMIKIITLHQSTIFSSEQFIIDMKNCNDLVTDVVKSLHDEEGMVEFVITVNDTLYSRYILMNKPTYIKVYWKLGYFNVSIHELRDYQEKNI